MYRVLLALHIVSIISWMAGMLYLFRLYVYHAEEREPIVQERFKVMETKLLRIITLPAMLASLIFGISMLVLEPSLLSETWMKAKLFFVILLLSLTHFAGHLRKRLEQGTMSLSAVQLRLLNEIPTLLMILIVFLAILKPF